MVDPAPVLKCFPLTYEVCQLYFSFPREFVCVALELKLT